jgi:HD-GYP domain-containing protein (c-di-GMP phosphodiesterase class II)
MGDIQAVVDAFLQALGSRRSFVAGHARRVSAYAVRLATQYGLAADVVESIRVGALLHDAGKLLVPVRILTKPGRLTKREWVELRAHPDKGIDLLERVGLGDHTRDIVLHHHERQDGKGYPDGLTGSEIPWPVRIVSVMDAFDALTSPREYRAALSVDAARALISREAGTRFCPWVVSGFLSLPGTALGSGSVDAHPDSYLPDGLPEMASLHATRAWMAVNG